MEILTVKDLTFTYPTSSSASLKNISFSVNEGEFIVVCGRTGGGKTTLLKQLVPSIAPLGNRLGDIDTHKCKIAYVCQSPNEQIVCDKVYAELAFALENQAMPRDQMIAKIAEASGFFGLDDILYSDCDSLSGGQKQIVAIASAMICRPDVLVLDEPTSRLDPIAKEKLLSLIKKINRELACCVIISEHYIEPLLEYADKMLLLDKELIYFGSVDGGLKALSGYPPLKDALPASTRIYSEFNIDCKIPITVKDGRNYIRKYFKNDVKYLSEDKKEEQKESAIEIKNVYFRYTKNGKDILNGADLCVKKGQVFCLLGGNGSGKSTLLSIIAGALRAYSGEIRILGKRLKQYSGDLYKTVTLLPQDVLTVFSHDTVRQELQVCKNINEFPYDFTPILDNHPYDISGGQAQLLALAMATGNDQSILLLDEPTKGLDKEASLSIADMIKKLKESGKTVLCVTHDSEFAAMCADRCALLFSGECTQNLPTAEFFRCNTFYTTPVSIMTRNYYENVLTVEKCVEIMKINGEKTV